MSDDDIPFSFPYCDPCGEQISSGDLVEHYITHHHERLLRAILTDEIMASLKPAPRRSHWHYVQGAGMMSNADEPV